MANKLILKCMDGQKEYTYEKAKIYTKKYTSKLTKSSLHSPRAAKIIFSEGVKQYVLLVKMPIIYVGNTGVISIFAQSTLDESTLKKKYEFDDYEKANIKIRSKLLQNKQSLGLTKREALIKNTNRYQEDMIHLVKTLGRYTEGGGFND